jgi:amino acid transporter
MGLGYLSAFAFSSLMSAWTLTGFEGAANVAEETHQPQERVPGAIVLSEVFSVVLGFLVLVGFTLAIPALDAVQNQPTPLLSIISCYFSSTMTHFTMLLVFISIFASALANLTTLTRMVWAMARDAQLPASGWLSRVSPRQVPANAIWAVTLIAIVFTFWAKVEVVITGIATLAGYLTYAVVVGATLWGRGFATGGSRWGRGNSEIWIPASARGAGNQNPEVESSKSKIQNSKSKISQPRPRALSVAALAWILLLLAMLSLPRSAWTNSLATLAAVALGGVWYFLARPAR